MASAEQIRVERLVRQLEVNFQRAFLTFVRNVKSDSVLRQVREYLEAGNVTAALGIANSHIARLGGFVARAFQEAGINEADALWRLMTAGIPGGVVLSFDPTHPRAAVAMRQNTLQFVREFTAQQAAATRTALTDALAGGQGAIAASRAFRDSIGLTTYQQEVVANYRRSLEAGSTDALDRALRDRRFDPTVAGAVAGTRTLTPAQIDRMVERYQDRMIAMRAETIARTENIRIVNQARAEALTQVTEQLGIRQERVVRVWRATPDSRTRDTHAAMDGQERGLNEPFESPSGALLMYPGDPSAPPGETINCRCVLLHEIRTLEPFVAL